MQLIELKTNDQKVRDNAMLQNMKLRVELAMQIGGAFEDCMTPAQAIELVKSDEEIERSRRARNGRGVMRMAA